MNEFVSELYRIGVLWSFILGLLIGMQIGAVLLYVFHSFTDKWLWSRIESKGEGTK
jgi:hypothetical protein